MQNFKTLNVFEYREVLHKEMSKVKSNSELKQKNIHKSIDKPISLSIEDEEIQKNKTKKSPEMEM